MEIALHLIQQKNGNFQNVLCYDLFWCVLNSHTHFERLNVHADYIPARFWLISKNQFIKYIETSGCAMRGRD